MVEQFLRRAEGSLLPAPFANATTFAELLSCASELVQPEQSEAVGILAVEAAASAVESHVSSTLRHSSSAVPLGQTPEMTYGDVWRYVGDCLELLIALSGDPRAAVKERAGGCVFTASVGQFHRHGSA